jgi:hypothetical protein
MKQTLFFILTILSLNTFSQSSTFYNKKIAASVYNLIDSSSTLQCCEEKSNKKWANQITYDYVTEINCFDDFNCLNDYYLELHDDKLIETISKTISNFYFKSYSEKKRRSFKTSCWLIDRKVVVEDNMSEDGGLICTTTHFKIIFYFQ